MALNLILEIAGGPELEIGDPPRKVFDAGGGRIGRGLDCDWVLSNRYVSRHHATVACVDGVFYIESVGANGVAVNSSGERLSRRERRQLAHGDRLFLDEYEISVSLAEPTGEETHIGFKVPPEEDVLAHLLTVVPQRDAPTEASPVVASDLLAPSLLTRLQVIQAPVVGPAAELDDDDITIEAAALLDVPAFFEALGLDASSITADMGAALAQMVRASFQGLLEVERARSQFESRLRLKRPRVPTDPARNPLKSAASVEEALGALLRSRPPGALSPRDAVEDVFDDLRFQHLSMLAGMRAGFASVMTRFDPRKLMAQANQGKQKGLSGLAAKARYWDRFIELFDHAVTYPDAGLQRSYCEEFYDAYGRQLEELKRHHRINGSL